MGFGRNFTESFLLHVVESVYVVYRSLSWFIFSTVFLEYAVETLVRLRTKVVIR